MSKRIKFELRLGVLLTFGCACFTVGLTTHGADASENHSTIEERRIGRPAITLDLNVPLITSGANREPIAEASEVPGIYRSFLVWRQKYAHLAICPVDLCNGSCINYGDACLVCGQSPVLPDLINQLGNTHGCFSGCAPSYAAAAYVRPVSSSPGPNCCTTGGCH